MQDNASSSERTAGKKVDEIAVDAWWALPGANVSITLIRFLSNMFLDLSLFEKIRPNSIGALVVYLAGEVSSAESGDAACWKA